MTALSLYLLLGNIWVIPTSLLLPSQSLLRLSLASRTTTQVLESPHTSLRAFEHGAPKTSSTPLPPLPRVLSLHPPPSSPTNLDASVPAFLTRSDVITVSQSAGNLALGTLAQGRCRVLGDLLYPSWAVSSDPGLSSVFSWL
jgi:hypothetical protein